jgi:hypothetical protein
MRHPEKEELAKNWMASSGGGAGPAVLPSEGPDESWYFTAAQLADQPSIQDGLAYDVSAGPCAG